MLNLLSYIGMNLQSELCLWTMLGLLRTIFDATLFKVNANLKQVWQMEMPAELSMPVQRVLRTMVSGVMLVQCFTVYVYLACYIVLLYPVFLEERPTLVLPWLLLAAVRKFLCELTCLALGLGACLLLGPARPPCIKFVVTKIATITPSFYMWMLVFSYYNTLKVASAFKTFPAALQSSDHDYGLELAVRRRRTKSLQDEEQLRKKIVASFHYESGQPAITAKSLQPAISTRMVHATDTDVEDSKTDFNMDILVPLSATSERLMSNVGSYEDWCGDELMLPRDADRILEQFVLMLLRISAYIKIEGSDAAKLFSSTSRGRLPYGSIDCTHISNEEAETPPQVGSSKGRTASYLQEYPQIFMKKTVDGMQRPAEQRLGNIKTANNQTESNTNNEGISRYHKLLDSTTSIEIKPLQIEAKTTDEKDTEIFENKANISILEETDEKEASISATLSLKNIKNKLDFMLEEQNEWEKTSSTTMTISDVKPKESYNNSTAGRMLTEHSANSSRAYSLASGQSRKSLTISEKNSKKVTSKESKLKNIQLKIISNTDVEKNTSSKDNIRGPSANSVKRMNDSLSRNKKSHHGDENKNETNSSSEHTSSRALGVSSSNSSNISKKSTSSSEKSKSAQNADKDDKKP